MQSIGMLAVVTGTLLLVSACSDGAGTPPPDNAAPVADFALPSCTLNQACSFSSTSTDDEQVTEWSWDFDGDGTPDASTPSASFTYNTPATFDVSLEVRDAQGLSDTKTSSISIADNNAAPVADFAPPACVLNAACNFVSTSTDDEGVTEWSWDFNGDGTPDATTAEASFTYTTGGTFNASLIVRDAQGLTNTKTVALLINTPPTAGFIADCDAGVCTFTSTSTDVAPGTITTYAWTFGDHGTASVANPKHSYAVVNPTNFTVTLTVTDNDGATDVETQTVFVAPPAPGAEGCVTSGIKVDCHFIVTSRSIIKLKLLGVSCTLAGERIVIPPPSSDQVFLTVCLRAVGDSTKIFGGIMDRAFIFEAGSQVTIRFVQGTADSDEPTPGPPAGQLTGTFPNWVINFEDGANPGAADEPDFADVVLGVEAVPSP
jgi:PKD repeat protein